MQTGVAGEHGSELPALPCACANLRRAARAVTRFYAHELKASGLEATQFTLLMVLDRAGEMTQGDLGRILAIDSTTLTRTLGLLQKRGLIRATPGADRRERHWSFTRDGRSCFQRARPDWERAQRRLHRALGDAKWGQLARILAEVAQAAG